MLLRSFALGAMAAALPAAALAQQAQPAEIETQQLQALDAWSVGTLTAQHGALPRDLWAQSDPAALAAIFDRLPSVYESPASQMLARRVLLSGGAAPRGEAQEAARKRFEALGRMGAADELAQMAAGASGALRDAAIAQYAAQAELARGRRAEACARGRSAQGETPAHFILRLRAYCAAVGGDRAAADLALELARGNGGEDAWYTNAIGAVSAGAARGVQGPAARYDTSLSAAVSLAASLRPGANPLANASTLSLLTLARNEQTPQPIRAQAAAAAFRRGALSAADARAILSGTPAEVSSIPLATALRAMAAARPAPRDPAAAPPTWDGASAAEMNAIAGALRQATNPADFAAAARLFRADIAALHDAAHGVVSAPLSPPDPNVAVLLARAALATGDEQFSRRMIDSARRANADAAALAPLDAALAVMMNARAAEGQMAVQRRIDAATAQTRRAAARDVALLGALGFPLDGAAQAFLLANAPQGGARADAGAMAALHAALARGASGDAALLAVIAAGDGVATLDAESAAAIIRALRTARLDGEARRMAVEALLAGAPG